eukprot:665496-Prymnesium_polylepis.1
MISQKGASHRNHRHQNKTPPCDSRRERIGRARSRRIKPSGSKTRPGLPQGRLRRRNLAALQWQGSASASERYCHSGRWINARQALLYIPGSIE